MPIWDHPAQQIARQLDCRQFHFLAAPSAELFLSVLVELYRNRQQDSMHEVPFDALYERLLPAISDTQRIEGFDSGYLRRILNQLEDFGNIAMRLEPRRVRRIADRGLKLLLVRLTERTNSILEHLESQLEELQQEASTSARFSLLEVDDALGAVTSLLDAASPISHDDSCRAARELFRARRAVEEAGDDLLARDLWLSETAVQTPDRQRLADLLTHLESYFERYLHDVDQRRGQCFQRLERLLTPQADQFLNAIQDANSREYADDPTRSGRRAPEIRLILRTIWEFLRTGGILDDRRLVVHQRLADVAGHLKRHLAELVRRSQLVAALRNLGGVLLHAPASAEFASAIDLLFLKLWQPAHAVLDESTGVPCERAVPPRPYVYRPVGRRRFTGATIRPSDNGQVTSERPTMIKKMTDLNDFVFRFVLRGSTEALVSDSILDDMSHVRLLIAAIRMARLEKSRLRKRYLQYSVAFPMVEKRVFVATGDGAGRLHLPQLIFSTEPQNGQSSSSASHGSRRASPVGQLNLRMNGTSQNGS